MPRSSTTTSPVSRSRPVASPAPVVVAAQPPTLGQTIKDGFGFGFGNAIAQRVATSLFGAPSVTVEQKKIPTAYEQCIAENRDDVALCAHLAEKK
jgi:hypothetical protein